ncbi:MAG: ATP-binding protein, partial [Clostridia bacterium]|nr:ATP-binding protein [Clostridia bacterium]
CKCAPNDVRRYLDKISGPLLDRIDIQVEVPAVTDDEMTAKVKDGDSSAVVRARVEAAREFGRARFEAAGDRASSNAAMTASQIRRHCHLDDRAAALLKGAFESMGLSARGHDRILRVARTVADMDGCEVISASHIAEAIQYRSLDRKYWNR